MKVSRACKPPFSITAADLSNMDLGTVCPDRSSMAAGKFSEARTLMTKGNKQTNKQKRIYDVNCIDTHGATHGSTVQLLIYFGSLEVKKIAEDLTCYAKKKKTNFCPHNSKNRQEAI